MRFSEIVGQDALKQQLIASAQNGRISHALMFLGPAGAGALPLALAFGQYINCLNPGPNDSCGECSSCTKSAKLIHPDYHYTFPSIRRKKEEGSYKCDEWLPEFRSMVLQNPYMTYVEWMNLISAGENKQGNITKADCHELIRTLSFKSYEAKYKIQYIWLAEYLGIEGNTILKILEEPPEDTIFILVVEQVEAILSTIISRTQIVRVPALPDEVIEAALAKKYEMEGPELRRISRIADGNYNTGIQMAEGGYAPTELSVVEWLRICYSKGKKNDGPSIDNLLSFVSTFAELGREKQKNFFKYSLYYLRECISLKNGLNCKLEGEEKESAARLLPILEPIQVYHFQQLINNAHYAIERNAAPKSVMISTCIKMSRIFTGEFQKELA